MTCRELIGMLDDFVEGGMAAKLEAYCRDHLEICPECRDYLGSYLATRRLAREAGRSPAEEAPPELLAKILAAAAAAGHLD